MNQDNRDEYTARKNYTEALAELKEELNNCNCQTCAQTLAYLATQ